MLGRRIKLYRLQQGLKKNELAERLGISTVILSELESDERMPDGQMIINIASALGIDVSSLMFNVPHTRNYQHGEFRKQSSLDKTTQAEKQQ